MVINEEEKNAFTQSVMGDTEGGGLPTITEADEGKVLTVADGSAVWGEGGASGSVVWLTFDDESAKIDASFNELLNYYNGNKFTLFKIMSDNEGITNYGWYILTQLKRESYDQTITYYSYFTSFPFFDGAVQPDLMIFYSTDTDEDMVIRD